MSSHTSRRKPGGPKPKNIKKEIGESDLHHQNKNLSTIRGIYVHVHLLD